MFRQLFYGVLMWTICLYAFRRGGWAERLAAAGIIVASYATLLVLSPTPSRYRHVEVAVVAVDCCLLLLLLFIALRSEKFWPLWLTAMQALTILSHFAPFVPHLLPWAYWTAVVMWIYPMLLVLAQAVRLHHREQKAALLKPPSAPAGRRPPRS